MKINIKDLELLKNGGFNLSQRAISGILLGTFFLGMGIFHSSRSNKIDTESLGSTVATSLSDYVNNPPTSDILGDEHEIIEPYHQEDPINVSLEQINSLNIVINDCNCSDEFISSVCSELQNDGIKFSLTKGCKDIDIDDSIIITLDEQYMAGPGTVVLAPFENNRLGDSDALAIVAWRAFYEKGFIVDGVSCGQMGFKENEDGTVSERVPTPTENGIGKDKSSSFVTISFGTQNTPPTLVASAIENMLTRFYSYNKDYSINEDLIYCVQKDDSYDVVSEKMGTPPEEINNYNDTIDKSILLPGETLVNPKIESIRPFDQHVPINLFVEKTLWSK